MISAALNALREGGTKEDCIKFIENLYTEREAGALNHYQNEAAKTAIYPGQGGQMGIIYCALKLNGEAGEIAEKVGKTIRDSHGIFGGAIKRSLAMELGDELWYIANLAKELGFTLQEIADMNLEKLASRKDRGTLSGSGDDR